MTALARTPRSAGLVALALLVGSSCLIEYEIPGADVGPEGESNPTEATETLAGDTEPEVCEEPFDLCDGECVDTRVNESYCGSCDVACELGELCLDGECLADCDDCEPFSEVCVEGVCECREGFTLCNGECVDIESNIEHCGECGEPCTPELFEVCDSGECVLGGNCDLDECDDACVDTNVDPLHCGDCDSPCFGDELCVGGICRAYEPLDEGCNTCPCSCEDSPGTMCCFSDYLDADVCLESGFC